jgi:hypothetical protein
MRILTHWAVLVSLLMAGLSIHGGKAEALSPSVRVSVSSSGVQANDGSLWPSISADGRYVAFESGADNLVSGDAAVGDQPYLYLEYYVPLEKYPTVLAILRASPNPSDASLVTYLVVFSESVTGVDASDFVLTTSGVVNASVTSVSGSGDTWSVTVHTGASSGTLRLDLVDDDSIRDSMNSRLGGYDPGNGDFTGGEVYTILPHPAFADVPLDYWAWSYIESIYLAGITGGCGNGNFCPETAVNRAQMAVFLQRTFHLTMP